MSSLDVHGRRWWQSECHALADEAAEGVMVAVPEAAVEECAQLWVGGLGSHVGQAGRVLEDHSLQAPEIAPHDVAGQDGVAVTRRNDDST
jgi:hypothetical protein